MLKPRRFQPVSFSSPTFSTPTLSLLLITLQQTPSLLHFLTFTTSSHYPKSHTIALLSTASHLHQPTIYYSTTTPHLLFFNNAHRPTSQSRSPPHIHYPTLHTSFLCFQALLQTSLKSPPTLLFYLLPARLAIIQLPISVTFKAILEGVRHYRHQVFVIPKLIHRAYLVCRNHNLAEEG